MGHLRVHTSRRGRRPLDLGKSAPSMKAFIVTAGVAFGLLFLAHVARIFEEGTHLLTQPVFLGTTLGSAAACGWAMVILKRGTRGPT